MTFLWMLSLVTIYITRKEKHKKATEIPKQTTVILWKTSSQAKLYIETPSHSLLSSVCLHGRRRRLGQTSPSKYLLGHQAPSTGSTTTPVQLQSVKVRTLNRGFTSATFRSHSTQAPHGRMGFISLHWERACGRGWSLLSQRNSKVLHIGSTGLRE